MRRRNENNGSIELEEFLNGSSSLKPSSRSEGQTGSDAVSDAVSCVGWCKAELSSKLPPHSSASSVQPGFRSLSSLISPMTFVAPLFLQPAGEITVNQWLI